MKKIYLFLLASVMLISCEGFLTRTPSAQIGSDVYFTNEGSLKTYLNGMIHSYTPSAGNCARGDAWSDLCATTKSTEFLTSTWTEYLQGGWDSGNWTMLYRCNYFLEHFREAEGLSEEQYLHYEGTMRFWRAMFYFEKVKTFGAVPYYDHVIDPNDEEALYKPRDSRDYVMTKVLEDINFASEHISGDLKWRNGAQIHKYTALATKSIIGLFEGTYRKYHAVDPSTGLPWPDPSLAGIFIDACIDACEELMEAGVYTIAHTPGAEKTQYRDLFTKETLNHTEVIWGREYNAALATTHDLTWTFTSGSNGQRWSMTQDCVRMYLNLDGTRNASKTTFFTDEMEGRDYRLQQTVIAPGYRKLVNGKLTETPPNFANTLTGYQIIKYNLDDTYYESASIAYNSLPIIRYAEVLLNYAEAKWEKGEFNDEVWNKTIKPLRERAGVKGSRPSVADPFLVEYYGINDCDALEIRRERAVELYLEGARYNDLMRWHQGKILNNTWYGIYVPDVNIAYDLNGDGIKDVCFYNTDNPDNDPGVVYIKLDGSRTLENGTSGRVIYHVPRIFDEQRYLRPIPNSALVVNKNLGQNAAWATNN